jgi:hypothetical protein
LTWLNAACRSWARLGCRGLFCGSTCPTSPTRSRIIPL